MQNKAKKTLSVLLGLLMLLSTVQVFGVGILPVLADDECDHDWVYVGETDYDCINGQTKYYECSKCSEPHEETVPGTGAHTWIEDERWGNCVDGYTVYLSCQNCIAEDETHEDGPGEHDWEVTYREGNATFGWHEWIVCRVCGAEDERDVPGTGEDSFEYGVLDDNTAIITEYYGSSENLVIPSEIEGYTVTRIGSYVFEECGMHSVTIPDTVKEIQSGAFANCASLTSVTLPKSLEILGHHAFANTALTAVEIPKSLKESDDYYNDPYVFNGVEYDFWAGPFANCDALKTVTFETGITKIPAYLFSGCTGLEEITIPATVTKIEQDAFSYCLRLARVATGNGITYIESSAFDHCVSLREINLSKALTYIGAHAFRNTALTAVEIPKTLESCGVTSADPYVFNGVEYDFWGGPFTGCDALKTVTFETGATQVAESLFRGCTGLEEITIPASVTIIENNAFDCCLRLASVTTGNNLTEIGYSAFDSCVSLSEINLSKALTYIGASAFANTALTSVEIPKSLYDCGASYTDAYTLNGTDYNFWGGPFAQCDGLKTVTFEEGVTRIADNLFRGCTGLEEITIPDTITGIGSSAFDSCLRLAEVTFGSALAAIEDNAFYQCVSLPGVTLPESVTELGGTAFSNCASLESATLPSSLSGIENGLFEGCAALQTIEIPVGVEWIGGSAFKNCTSLEKIDFADGERALTSIGSSAFEGCASLTYVAIPTVTSVEWAAFKNCTSLTRIDLPETLKSLGEEAFYGCAELTEVFIPDYTLTTIEDQTFAECAALEGIRLPKGLKSISEEAFLNDVNFREVTIFSSVTEIDAKAFSYPTLITVYGVAGTYAETYANNKGCTFSNIATPLTGFALVDMEGKVIDEITLEHGQRYHARFKLLPENSPDCITLSEDGQDIVYFEGLDIVADSWNYYWYDKTGTCTVTATSDGGITYPFTVNVIDAESLRVNPPSKTTYNLGEPFDPAGMEVFACFTNGTERFLNTFEYTVTGFDSSKEGANVIRISWTAADGDVLYQDITLTIFDPTGLNGIRIGSLPAKLAYEEGEELVTTGLTVFATYNDGSELELTAADYTVTGYNPLKRGVQTVTVSYQGFTATFTVTVGTVHEHSYEPRFDDAFHWTACACGQETVRIPHTWGAGVDTTPATCTAQGVRSFNCTGCAYVREDQIPALGHADQTIPGVAATCTKAGKTAGVKCSRCGVVLTAQTTAPALGHDMEEDPVGVQATCTEDGNLPFCHCKRCGKYFIDAEGQDEIDGIPVIKAKGHDYKDTVTKATPTKDGKIVPTCSVCGATKTATKIAKVSKISISKTKYVYNGKVQKPTLTVKDSAGKAISSSYYTVKWRNASSKAVGSYTVTVTFKGNYSGSKSFTYTIAPKQVTGVKNAAPATKSITLSWKKATGATKYEVYGSTDGKTFKKITTVSTNTAKITKVNGKALAAGKTYYFKVRAMDGSKKLIGEYSKVLKTGTLTAAPKITKLTSAKSKTATVTWGKVTGAKSYVVYKSTDGKKWTEAGTTTDTSLTLKNLTGGKKIHVKVLSVNAYKANSAYSEAKSVTVKK